MADWPADRVERSVGIEFPKLLFAALCGNAPCGPFPPAVVGKETGYHPAAKNRKAVR
jgi:hypothetical protein